MTTKLAPLLRELVNRCGGTAEAAKYAGIGRMTAFRVRAVETPTINAQTARLIILALYQRRKEDRRNGASEQFLKALKHQARREEQLERLAGY